MSRKPAAIADVKPRFGFFVFNEVGCQALSLKARDVCSQCLRGCRAQNTIKANKKWRDPQCHRRTQPSSFWSDTHISYWNVKTNFWTNYLDWNQINSMHLWCNVTIRSLISEMNLLSSPPRTVPGIFIFSMPLSCALKEKRGQQLHPHLKFALLRDL